MTPDPARIYDGLDLTEHLWRAQSFAQVAHWGQEDKSGNPYFFSHILHAIGMFEQRARRLPGEIECNLDEHDCKVTKMAILLHDVLEDTPVTQRMLIDLGFPARVTSLVDLLTRRREVPKHLYYSRLRKEPEGRFAKAADMDSNTAPSRIQRLDPETQIRLLDKYLDGFQRLELDPLWNLRGLREHAEGLLEDQVGQTAAAKELEEVGLRADRDQRAALADPEADQ